METVLLGALSLVSGLILGIIFSKLFSMFLAKAMFLEVHSLFFLSIPSLIQTTIVFLLMLVMVSFRSAFLIYRYNLNKEFDRVNKKNEENNTLNKKDIFLSVPLVPLFYFIVMFSWNLFIL